MSSRFRQLLFNEAPEDEATDTPADTSQDTPTDDTSPPPEPSPTTDSDDGSDLEAEAPPDFDDGLGDVDDNPDDPDNEDEEPQIGEKISKAMNGSLYQRYLTMLNTVDKQLSFLKANSDIVFTHAPEAIDITEPLNKLAENIRLYLSNNFLSTNYSKNLLFFNKCLNLLVLLDEQLGKELKKTEIA